MKRFAGLLNRSKSSDSNSFLAASSAPVDSPEANAARSIRLFCESASDANREEEVLHLPVIVEAAESSPAAASAAAQQIKRFLSRDYATKPAVQYNAIMLVRILSDNPGPTFTRCFDQSFVKTVKELLRGCKDHGTQQILREALDSMEVNKAYDEGVQGLIAMWRKEKGSMNRLNQPRGSRGPGGYQPGQGHVHSQNNERIIQRNQLPPAHELASRIEEARNTAKILLQLIQQTPPEELVGNELVREFSERCQAAQKSMQVYINCDSPPPDDDTMLTLIETNEQLSLAGSRYQRANLTARRQLGTAPSEATSPEAMNDGYGAFTSPPAAGQAESLFRPAPPTAPGNDYAEDSPVSPILQQTHSNGHSQYSTNSNNNAYQIPPGPPPRQDRHQHTPSTTSSIYVTNNPQEATSNPFLDPIEHAPNPPALAMPPPSSRKPVTEPSPTTYSYNSASPTTSTSNSAFPSDGAAPAPLTDSHTVPRPGIGPYHSSGISPSYMGRQSSAANGLTMHGAGSQDSYTNKPVELDGNSNIGRNGHGYDENYTVSPVAEERTDRMGRRISRVDVAGTGGLRDPRV